MASLQETVFEMKSVIEVIDEVLRDAAWPGVSDEELIRRTDRLKPLWARLENLRSRLDQDKTETQRSAA